MITAMKFRALVIALVGTVTASGVTTPARAQDLEVQLFLGSAVSLPLPVTIAQAGEPDISFTARWKTRPTHPTWYYAWRLGIWNGDRGWRLDHTHHKLHLTNFPADVEDLRITNGYNIVSVSRAFRSRRLTYSFGAGPVITFPISTVLGKKFTHDNGVNGYHLSGGGLMAMATREFTLTGGLILSLDARASASWVRSPIVDGHAKVPNAALHLHAGLGFISGR
jgi:hypothetical protein